MDRFQASFLLALSSRVLLWLTVLCSQLARVLLPIFDPEAMLDEEDESKRSAFSSIPVFDTPKSIYCRLPGNNVFFHMGSLGLLHGSIQCKKRYTEVRCRWCSVHTVPFVDVGLAVFDQCLKSP